MPFDSRDIRLGMDVFTLDGQYLGAVRRIRIGPAAPRARIPLRAEASVLSGELLGPQPTGPLGNPGPATQSATAHYAAAPDDALPLGEGSLIVGRLPFPLGWREIPLSEVLVVSFERVIVRRTATQLGVQLSRVH